MNPISNEIFRYVIAGGVNTLIGYGVFLVALWRADLSPELSNILGYSVGLSIAFVLNRFFVFKGVCFSLWSSVRFLTGFASAFLLNQAMLFFLVNFLKVAPEIAQIFAMTTYTLIFYLINKYLVWN